MSHTENVLPKSVDVALCMQRIEQLDRVNMRLGWVLANARILDSSQRESLRQLMDVHADTIAQLTQSLESAGVRTDALPLLSLPQSSIVHPAAPYASLSEEVVFMQRMDLRLREAHDEMVAVVSEPAALPNSDRLKETLAFLHGHIKAIKFYLQSL